MADLGGTAGAPTLRQSKVFFFFCRRSGGAAGSGTAVPAPSSPIAQRRARPHPARRRRVASFSRGELPPPTGVVSHSPRRDPSSRQRGARVRPRRDPTSSRRCFSTSRSHASQADPAPLLSAGAVRAGWPLQLAPHDARPSSVQWLQRGCLHEVSSREHDFWAS